MEGRGSDSKNENERELGNGVGIEVWKVMRVWSGCMNV
jgi:hypothetical protein